jgi:hypothetical protein
MQKFGALFRRESGTEQRLGVVKDRAARQNGLKHIRREVDWGAHSVGVQASTGYWDQGRRQSGEQNIAKGRGGCAGSS